LNSSKRRLEIRSGVISKVSCRRTVYRTAEIFRKPASMLDKNRRAEVNILEAAWLALSRNVNTRSKS
jgi:hypothetical protein